MGGIDALLLTYDGQRPAVAPSAFVAPGAILIGRVTVGEGASIWYNSVLRGDRDDIVIGPYSNIQDNCTIHLDPGKPALIGAYVTVGHGAIVHGCTVEDNVLIGMNATILTGATIGRDTIVGANALVPENASIPPGSLALGVPARVVRELRPDEVMRIRRGAVNYHEHSRRFLAQVDSR